MVKKLVLLLATAAGAAFVQKKMKDQQAEQDLWAAATDRVPPRD
ncbi:DLW-39 family protein [Segeticoccus rhizosphaerae]|jgi:hypothetical protein|nr:MULTISPECIES: DLW-39 family protein [Intrasporangiaceae]